MKRGFTLVELTIVLVIIGVILGGAVKAAELVKDARAKRTLSRIVLLADAQHRFFERAGRYAGDADNDGILDFQTINSNAYPDENNVNTADDMDYPFTELEQMGILAEEANINHSVLPEGGSAYFAGYLLSDDGRGNTVSYNLIVIRDISCLTTFHMEQRLDNQQLDADDSASSGRVRAVRGTALSTGDAWTSSGLCMDADGSVSSTISIDAAYLFDRFN